MTKIMIKALRDHYQSQINSALAEIDVMSKHPVSVAEHNGFINMYLKEIHKITEAEENLKTMEKYIHVP